VKPVACFRLGRTIHAFGWHVHTGSDGRAWAHGICGASHVTPVSVMRVAPTCKACLRILAIPYTERWRVQNGGTFKESNRGEFDEIAVGGWLHVERLNETDFYVSVGERTMWVTVARDGSTKVTHEETRAHIPPPKDILGPAPKRWKP
jgi:hypothetical protein